MVVSSGLMSSQNLRLHVQTFLSRNITINWDVEISNNPADSTVIEILSKIKLQGRSESF
jgi:hypothetical protein